MGDAKRAHLLPSAASLPRGRDVGPGTSGHRSSRQCDALRPLLLVCFPLAALFAGVEGTSGRVLPRFGPALFWWARRSSSVTRLRNFFFATSNSFPCPLVVSPGAAHDAMRRPTSSCPRAD